MPTLYFEFDRRSDFSAPDYFRQRHAYRSPRSSAATNLEIQSFLYSVLKLKKSQGDFAFDFNNTAVRITEGSTESFVLNSQIPESTEQSGLEDLAVRLNTLKARIGALESKRVNTGSYLKSATLAWRAKDVEGLKAPDISGNGFDALFGADGENPTANDPVHLERDDESYLYLPGVVGNYVEVPDSAALDITGDIDLRVDVALDDWSTNPYILGKDGTASGGYSLRQISDGTLRLLWDDGVTALSKTSTSPMGASEGERLQVRATLDVDNGAGGHDVKFYTRSSGDLSSDFGWTQLGPTITTAGTTAIGADTNDLAIGAYGPGSGQCTGKLYRAIIKDGIDGDTVLDLDFTAGDKTRPRDASLISTATGAWRAASIAPDGSLKDLTGNGRNMVPSGGPTALGYDGTRYLYLPGVDGNHATESAVAGTTATGVASITLDIEPESWSPATSGRLIDVRGSQGGMEIFLSSVISVRPADSTNSIDILNFDPGELTGRHELICSYDPSTQTAEVWVDGVSLGTETGTITEMGLWGSVSIGAANGGSTPSAGKFYRVVVSDGSGDLFDIDFTDATQFPDGMDSTSGTASTGQTVTLEGRALIVDKPALYFDGVDDFLSIPDDDAFDVDASTDLTVVTVARRSSVPSGNEVFIAKKSGFEAAGNAGWAIAARADGNVQGRVTPTETSALATYPEGEVTVIGAVLNRTDDTWEVNETSVSATAVTDTSNSLPLNIGRSSAANDYAEIEFIGAAVFVGQVLTADEIAQAGKELSLAFSDTTEFYGYDEARSKVLARTSQVGSIIRSTVDKKSVVVERDVLLFGDAAYMRIMDPEFDFSSDYTIITAVRTHNTPDETQQFFNTGLGAGPAVRLEQTTDDTFKAVQVSGSADMAEVPIVYGYIQIVALGYDTENEEFFLSANGITDKDLTRSAGDPSNDNRDMGIGSNTTGANNRLDAEMFGMAVYIGRVLTPTEIGIIGRELLGDSNYA